MGYTRLQFRTELSSIFNDSGNLVWSADQKNTAINLAIDALWPECKSTKVDETITLEASKLIYTPTAVPPEMGFQQTYLQQESDQEYLLLRRIQQKRELVSADSMTSVLKWLIYVPEDIVSANVGKKIRLHYHCGFDHYTEDTNPRDVPYLPVVYYGCLMLCTYMLQKAGSSNITVWRDQIPTWNALFLQAKRDNLVLSMPSCVGFRRA